MKKILSFLFLAVILSLFASCANDGADPDHGGGTGSDDGQVTADEANLYDYALQDYIAIAITLDVPGIIQNLYMPESSGIVDITSNGKKIGSAVFVESSGNGSRLEIESLYLGGQIELPSSMSGSDGETGQIRYILDGYISIDYKQQSFMFKDLSINIWNKGTRYDLCTMDGTLRAVGSELYLDMTFDGRKYNSMYSLYAVYAVFTLTQELTTFIVKNGYENSGHFDSYGDFSFDYSIDGKTMIMKNGYIEGANVQFMRRNATFSAELMIPDILPQSQKEYVYEFAALTINGYELPADALERVNEVKSWIWT